MVGGAHVALTGLYVLLGQPLIAGVNIASAVLFGFCILMLRAGRRHIALWLGFLEMAVHVPLLTYMVGGAAGYVFVNAAMAILPFLVFSGAARAERAVVVLTAGLSTVAVLVLGASWTPTVTLLPGQMPLLSTLIAGSCAISLIVLAWSFSAATERAEAKLELEQQRSEQLLLNVLPAAIAQRLKDNPGIIADNFDPVTVLFADLVGFTTLSSNVESAELVRMLNEIFTEFDRLAKARGLEKIKTIGDAYMVVGGVPLPMEDQTEAVVALGLDLLVAIDRVSESLPEPLGIRVGVHTGPAVAGVIGESKFAYDIWGDTVNVASRMESHGEPGRVHISAAARARLGEGFDVEDRGEIQIKGKGAMSTYFVLSVPAA
jgi:class 3 adenylate cyclase